MTHALARGITRREVAAAALVALVFAPAPTVGDVGGCGKEATNLDERAFSRVRKSVDCARCRECGVATLRCAEACDPKATAYYAFPATCRPLLHDGEVCVRALRAAACDTFATFVDDEAPAAPSECAFCRVPAGADGDDGGDR